jgi:hypothetical protein
MSDKLKTFSHFSHGFGDAIVGHHKPNIAQDGAPKHVAPVMVHPSMSKVSKSGAMALGGDHASALDSLSGLVVVPGKVGGEAVAHPLIKAPVDKPHLGKPVAPVPGQRSRTTEDCETYATKQQHGADMLAGATYSGSTPLLPRTVSED